MRSAQPRGLQRVGPALDRGPRVADASSREPSRCCYWWRCWRRPRSQEADDEEEEDDQAKAPVAVALMDREPFFQLTLTADNNNAVIEILPLESVPADLQPTDRLRVRLVKDPEQEYESWRAYCQAPHVSSARV